jgi:hypothetical protein
LRHTILVAEVEVQVAELVRSREGYTGAFRYPHEQGLSCGLIPDATILLGHGDKTGLWFVEVDCGTERITSPAGYSLAGKLAAYAQYFDTGQYQEDFNDAGGLQGFRVALILDSPAREHSVQRLITAEHHDFVLLTTFEKSASGLHHPVWSGSDNIMRDFLGRAMAEAGEQTGEQTGARNPMPEGSNS